MNKRNSTKQMATLKFALMIIVLLPGALKAQQDPTYSQFMYNGLAINPAVAGSAETLSASALYRQQWVGIEGAPETQTVNIDAPVYGKKIGLGLSIVNDKVGVTQNLLINTLYAYRIQFSKGTLSMGLQAGINNYTADYTSVETDPQNGTDGAFGNNINRMIFNFGSGAYYYSERLYAGFSVPHILNQSLDGISGDGIQSRQYRHYFLTAGYVFDAGTDVKIKPSALFKIASGAPVQVDINSNFWYKETYCLGASYRTKDSFTMLAQWQLTKQLRVGYAYDYLLTKLSQFTSGNHEIMLRFELVKKNTKIVTPRYF
jgi:type IX secretion system PorP/SprF family membrane protein